MSKQKGLGIAGVILAVILILVVSGQFDLTEDGVFTLSFGGSVQWVDRSGVDPAGNAYSYKERVSDTRIKVVEFQVPFVFGESPEWWSKLVGEEWLGQTEYKVGPAVQDGTITIAGWGDPAETSFWNCFHAINLCVLRHNDLPLVYR